MKLEIEQTSEQASSDKWNWEIFLKGNKDDLDKIEYLEYILHPTFVNPVRKIYDKDSGFKLKTSGWGTFPVYYRIKVKGKKDEFVDSLNLNFQNSVEKELEIG